ncbi:Hypothetical predicted protein, partial [Scomber scombrus]
MPKCSEKTEEWIICLVITCRPRQMARPEREESMTLHIAEKQPVVHQLQPVTPQYSVSACPMTDI